MTSTSTIKRFIYIFDILCTVSINNLEMCQLNSFICLIFYKKLIIVNHNLKYTFNKKKKINKLTVTWHMTSVANFLRLKIVFETKIVNTSSTLFNKCQTCLKKIQNRYALKKIN